ncbi:Tlg2-vesicle protein [Pleurotus ostreatus]|uniref:Golgi apparatus membrane protein TVP38 n=1 Tax=Pleurotus ostreatus TaxID=5322 RepID=A0A8H7DKK3_PLEOS|nr:Tlg2-vesicle protein [Pleurotus ostreatus]KAF7416291.1 Tlg2-vesicle protein [Pleurotus ostreatus]
MASGYAPYDSPPRHRHSLSDATDTTLHQYPPPAFDTLSSAAASTVTITPKDGGRDLNRTPSPTPSEARELKTGAIDWKSLTKWRFWIRREWAWYYVAIIIIVVITALVSIYHKEIVHALRPAADWLHKVPCGWLVPIGILFIISFPPLFGHEIVAILCGLVWGLWIGFGIVAAGTFIGEVGNFYAFKYCCRSRGEKLERTQISYACLAKVVRDGGFKIALVARLSAIPGHFTTAVFSTCGMGIFTFSLAAILSLPKQFVTVYLGVILEQSESGESTSTSKLISNIVLAITILITIAAMWYILRQMNKVKPEIIYARRKARQAKLARAHLSDTASEATLSGSDSELPLNSKPTLFAPQPQRMSPYTSQFDARPRDEESGEHYPRSQAHWNRREGGRDVLSIVREDSGEEAGWDMGINNAHAPVYAKLPPGVPDEPESLSNNPYLARAPPTDPHQTHQRHESGMSHVITFDPDAVTVSSAPHTPDITLPTPPYSQQTFTPLAYPTDAHNDRISPFRDPIPPPPKSPHSNVLTSRSTPNLITMPDTHQESMFPQSQSTGNTPELAYHVPSAATRGGNPYSRSAQEQPPRYDLQSSGHNLESTDATFHTAWGSSHSRDGSGLL